MKKRFYFLSIFILFLFNIGGVNAATSIITMSTSQNGTYYKYIGNINAITDPTNYVYTPDIGTTPSGASVLTVAKGSPAYFNARISFETNEVKSDYVGAILVYHFCDVNPNYVYSVNYVSGGRYKYEVVSTSKSCTYSNGARGSQRDLYIYTNYNGSTNFYSIFTIKPTDNSLNWWISYTGYEIFTQKQFEEYKQLNGINDKLTDLNDKQEQTNEKIDDLNDTINDPNSSDASGEAENFFSNFNTDTFGLTSVITAPLELIKSVTSKTCTPLQGTLPFVSTDVNLPCLSTIYENHFGSFLNIYRIITFGFISYWVCIKIFNLVKDFKNPEHDEIEVLDL